MIKHVAMHEIACCRFADGDFVVVLALVTHSRHVVKTELLRVPFEMLTAKATELAKERYDAPSASYQTAWLPHWTEVSELPGMAFTLKAVDG